MDAHQLIILGAGAAGLFAAITAALQGCDVLVVDHAKKPARKVVISGGGRCNITNDSVSAADYVCGNPHFVKSALARWTPWDMRDWLDTRGVGLCEEEGGKLFCACGGKGVAQTLWDEARQAGARFSLQTAIASVRRQGGVFEVSTDVGVFQATQLLVATGGLAWPQLGATDLGYRLARQLGLEVISPRPGLVPFTAPRKMRAFCQELAGVSLPVRIDGSRTCEGDMLFTHHGLSGPVILEASLHWQPGEPLCLDLLPNIDDIPSALQKRPKLAMHNALAALLPARLAAALCMREGWQTQVAQCSKAQWEAMERILHQFPFTPAGTAGHAKAEVTLGGVAVDRIDSKTMASKDVPGLYFAGEVLDVTGRLGGYNLHWAWASGKAAGSAAAEAAAQQ